jgi:hypothetical protein
VDIAGTWRPRDVDVIGIVGGWVQTGALMTTEATKHDKRDCFLCCFIGNCSKGSAWQ